MEWVGFSIEAGGCSREEVRVQFPGSQEWGNS